MRRIPLLRVLALLSLGAAAARGVQLHIKRARVQSDQISAPEQHWAQGGFFDMVAPIRPPTSADGSVRIIVYLRLPEGAPIQTKQGPHGELWLRYPPGTTADRVEYFGASDDDEPPSARWRVADVRGTTIEDQGEQFHVYRPTQDRPDAPLLGLLWPRGDEQAQARATEQLGALIETGAVVGPPQEAARNQAATHLRALNGCAGCHEHQRPPQRTPGLVNRGTDASGFFHVSTVLQDRAPLETYRPRNPNLRDPYVRFVCGTNEQPAERTPGLSGGVRCPGGEVPVGILDLAASLRAKTAHALRLCASRRHLYEHLDDAGKALFRPGMEACQGPQEGP